MAGLGGDGVMAQAYANIRNMEPVVADTPRRCLNCDSPLASTQWYCSVCGQKADTHRLSLHDIGHAVMHVFTHADHSALALVRDLAYKPGQVAREYVQGKRRKYFNPFTFALVIIGVASLVLAASGFVNFNRGVPANPVGTFLQKNINLVILVQLPLLSLFGMLFFRRDRLHFAEHLVLASYASGFRSIFFTALVAPVWMLTHWNQGITASIYLLLWVAYYGMASAQFYEGNRWWLWCKGALVAVLAQVMISLIIWGAFWVWFRFFYSS
jgi:hypothetical protein